MAHDHRETAAARSRGTLIATLALTGAYLVVEVVGGIGLALFAIWIAGRPPTPEKTYGYYRAEILAALVNAIVLLGVAAGILVEAYRRLLEPPEVRGGPMLAIAVL